MSGMGRKRARRQLSPWGSRVRLLVVGAGVQLGDGKLLRGLKLLFRGII